MKLSVIIPVYNVEMYIDQCVESIISQSFYDIEVILVDDGSTDKSGDKCDKWAKIDERIITLHKENGGQLSARNYGVKNANGEYIAFIDGDDYIGKDLFSDLFVFVETYKPDILAYGFTRVSEDGSFIDVHKNDCEMGFYSGTRLNSVIEFLVSNTNKKEYNMGSIFYGVALKIFRKDFYIGSVPDIPNDVVNGEDLAVTMKCITECSSLYVSDITTYYYRQRNNSMIHTFRSGDLKNYMVLCDFLINETNIIPHENIKKFMCEVISRNIFLAAKQLDSYYIFKLFFEANINDYAIELLNFATIKNVGLKNWIKAFVISNRIWPVFKLYRMLKKEK